MSHSNIIYVSMLGGCSLKYDDNLIDRQTVRSRRIWTLLEYLITNRNKTVTQDELIELLYPGDKSDAPLSALKTLVFRTREVLNRLCYTDSKQIIMLRSGGYMWNPDILMDIDVETFENTVNEASSLDSDKNTQLQLRLKAIALYKGDFLADSALETWVVPISAYYRYLYLNIVNLALEELSEQGRFSEIISIAQNSITIYPYEEHLYYYLILALANTNQIATAKAQYESMTKLFYNEFGVTPSTHLQALYKKLSTSDNGVEMDLSIIKSQMTEAEKRSGAFYCEYEFLKDIYRLEARSAARKGTPVHICLLSISGKDGNQLSKRTTNNVMNIFSDIIKNSLRSGDVYSRYSISQYVIILPKADYKNSELIMERIIKKFRQEHTHSPVTTTYSIQTIEANT